MASGQFGSQWTGRPGRGSLMAERSTSSHSPETEICLITILLNTHTHQLRMSLTTCTGKPNIELKQIVRRKEGEKGCGEDHQQCLPWSVFVIRCSEVRPGIFETSIQRSGDKSLFLPESWRLLIALGKTLSLTKTAHWFLQRPCNKSPIIQQKRPEPLRKFQACCCRPLVAKCHR